MKRCWHGVEMEERKMSKFERSIALAITIVVMILGGWAIISAVVFFALRVVDPDEPAYIVYADYQIEHTDDAPDIVRKTMESKLTAAPDIDTGKYEYRYLFVYLEDDAELYLVYTKDSAESSDGQPVRFDGVSGIEVFGLANQAADNAAEYEGERIMAQSYTDLLRELSKYMQTQ